MEYKILGVPTRGSEQKKRVIGHPIPINVDEIVPIIQEKVKNWNIDYVFVKAEEEETIEYIKTHVSNVLHTSGIRLKNFNTSKGIPASNANTKISRYQSLLDYLTDIYILSQCNSILGTMNNGLYTALIWNGGQYKHAEIIDKGIYK